MDKEEDLTHYHTSKGSTGRALVSGGPAKPDTTTITEQEAKEALKDWRKACKSCNKNASQEGLDRLMMLQ